MRAPGTIILSRTQNASKEKIDESISMIREKNPDATIITTPWDELSGTTIHEAMEQSVSLADQLLAEMKSMSTNIMTTIMRSMSTNIMTTIMRSMSTNIMTTIMRSMSTIIMTTIMSIITIIMTTIMRSMIMSTITIMMKSMITSIIMTMTTIMSMSRMKTGR